MCNRKQGRGTADFCAIASGPVKNLANARRVTCKRKLMEGVYFMERKSVSQVLRELIENRGVPVVEIARVTGIKKDTIYSLVSRDSDRASIAMLKALADFFDEDLEVFCGQPNYIRKPRLNEDELNLIAMYQKLSAENQAIIQAMVKQPPKPMSKTQQELLQKSYGINERGQAKLLDTCEDLLAGGRYKP